MPAKDEIERLTQLYWIEAHIRGLDPGSAALGLRYGIVIALRQPDYARMYAAATHRPESAQFEQEAVKAFMTTVPLMVGGNGNASVH